MEDYRNWKRTVMHEVVAVSHGYDEKDIIQWCSKVGSWTVEQLEYPQGLDTLDRRLGSAVVQATLGFKGLNNYIMNYETKMRNLGMQKGRQPSLNRASLAGPLRPAHRSHL